MLLCYFVILFVTLLIKLYQAYVYEDDMTKLGISIDKYEKCHQHKEDIINLWKYIAIPNQKYYLISLMKRRYYRTLELLVPLSSLSKNLLLMTDDVLIRYLMITNLYHEMTAEEKYHYCSDFIPELPSEISAFEILPFLVRRDKDI